MKLFKNFFLITFIILFSLNNLKADEKISYLDIEFILANTLAGKSLLENLKKVEDTKINEFKANDL